MILLVLFYCAILKLAFSVPVKDVLQVNVRPKMNMEKSTSSVENAPNIVKSLEASSNVNNLYDGKNGNDPFFLETKSLGKIEKYSQVSHVRNRPPYQRKMENTSSITAEMKEYFFLSDWTGTVIITDDGLNVIASHELPELCKGTGAIVNDKFYNIDTLKGQIISTDIENLMTSGNDIPWNTVGLFPSEPYYARNEVAVDESSIYFVTFNGLVYVYDTTTKATMKIGNIEAANTYTALLIVGKTLYIHKDTHFYSIDGITIKEIATPQVKGSCGLFKLRNLVCLLGGNTTVISSDPVSCYDPISGQWSVNANLEKFIRFPGITTAQNGVYIFGGEMYVSGSQSWRNDCFLLNPEYLILGYIPCPFTKAPMVPQAISFFH